MKGHQPQILNLIDPSNTYTEDGIEIGRLRYISKESEAKKERSAEVNL